MRQDGGMDESKAEPDDCPCPLCRAYRYQRIPKLTVAEADATLRKYMHERLDKWIDDCLKRDPFEDSCPVGKLKLVAYRQSAGVDYYSSAAKVMRAEAVLRSDPDPNLMLDIHVTETIEEY